MVSTVELAGMVGSIKDNFDFLGGTSWSLLRMMIPNSIAGWDSGIPTDRIVNHARYNMHYAAYSLRYRGTPLLRTPWGPNKVYREVSSFQG